MPILRISVLFLLFASLSAAQTAASPSLLPESFSGWSAQSIQKQGPAAADAAALKEYGLEAAESRSYQRSGRRITVNAYRFVDATGAYGAFSYFRQPAMVTEQLCDGAVSERTHVLFHCANVLLDVQLDKVTAMTMAELRSLAAAVPKLSGPRAQTPNLALYLPENIRKGPLQFSLGPAAYGRSGSPVPADLIGFDRSPEVVVKDFRALDGFAKVTLIIYPTPAIATQQLTQLESWSKAQPAPTNEGGYATILARRSGPLVAIVTGDIAPAEARRVLEDINFEADVNWTEPTFQHPRDNIGGLVYAAIILAIIIFGVTVAVGIILGFFRVGLRKLFPRRFPDPAEEGELIRLRIDR
jgi:hypothetical protein